MEEAKLLVGNAVVFLFAVEVLCNPPLPEKPPWPARERGSRTTR